MHGNSNIKVSKSVSYILNGMVLYKHRDASSTDSVLNDLLSSNVLL